MEPEQKALPEGTAPKTQQIPLKEPQKAELEIIPENEQPEERSPPKKEIPEPIHSPSPSPVKKEEPDIETTSKLKAQESDDDTLEVNLHPEKSRWELSDDEEEDTEPKPTPKTAAPIPEVKHTQPNHPVSSQNHAKQPAIDVDSNKHQDSSEDSGRKIKKKKKRRHTSDSD